MKFYGNWNELRSTGALFGFCRAFRRVLTEVSVAPEALSFFYILAFLVQRRRAAKRVYTCASCVITCWEKSKTTGAVFFIFFVLQFVEAYLFSAVVLQAPSKVPSHLLIFWVILNGFQYGFKNGCACFSIF